MSTVGTKIKEKDIFGGNNIGNNNLNNGNGGDEGNNGGSGNKFPPKKGRTSPMLFFTFAMIPIVMFFGAIVFVYLAHEFNNGWKPITMPSAVILSTVVLIASSLTIEKARKALTAKLLEPFKNWIMVSTFLGILFLTTQLVAWQQLISKGVYMAAVNPHATFFYILTAAHGLHLLGGLIGLSYVLFGAMYYRFNAERRSAVDVTAAYWHFMDGLWIFLFLLLFVWK